MFSKLRKLAENVSDSMSQKLKEMQAEELKDQTKVSDTKVCNSLTKSYSHSESISHSSCSTTSHCSGSTTISNSPSAVLSNENNNSTDNNRIAADEINPDKDSASLSLDKVILYFENHKKKYADTFSSSSFFDKIAKFAKKTGLKFSYKAMLLFYGLKSDEIPSANKMIAVAGLGYFIAPFDFLADILPGGFLDDGLVLSFALDQVYSSLSKSTKQEAIRFLHEIFGDFNDDDLN